MTTTLQPRPAMSEHAARAFALGTAEANRIAEEVAQGKERRALRFAAERENARARGWQVGPRFHRSDRVWDVMKVIADLHTAGYFAVLVPIADDYMQVEYRPTTALREAMPPMIDALRECEGCDHADAPEAA